MAFISQIKLSDTTYDISAIKLKNARTIQTNLASTSTASFDGTANITPGVTGILGYEHGGTNANSRVNAWRKLMERGTNNTDFNTVKDCGIYWCQLKDCTNTPLGNNKDGNYGYLEVWNAFDSSTDNMYQRFTLYNNGRSWFRSFVNSTWTSWYVQDPSQFLPLSGGTMSGQIKKNTASSWVGGRDAAIIRSIDSDSGSFHVLASAKTPSGSWEIGSLGENFRFSYVTDTHYNAGTNSSVASVYVTNGGVLMGAAWNDYAEYRICNEEFKPGQVTLENGDDTLSITSQRLQRGCSIVSDTFGFAIGETDEAKCPVAVSGRVLAYGYESREEFKKHIGWPVCSGPNGTVSIMTEEEEEKYPSRIIGTISAVPDYETWGTRNVEVNNRIWIKIK